ncbi:MAG: porin [Proteobacteria bacterium]|nr:porin [Pseudomonadota bacterium]
MLALCALSVTANAQTPAQAGHAAPAHSPPAPAATGHAVGPMAAGQAHAPAHHAPVQGAPAAYSAPVAAAAAAPTTGLMATKLELGGFVKADFIYNSASRATFGGGEDLFEFQTLPGAIPTTDADDGGANMTFNPRETRIWMTATTPTELGDVIGYIEFDFYSVSPRNALGNERLTNSALGRLRVARVNFKGFHIGMDWTSFMYHPARPEKVDLGSPAFRIFIRQNMLRYGGSLGENASYNVALETPETTIFNHMGFGASAAGLREAAGMVVPDQDRLPDVMGQINYELDKFKFSVMGIARELRINAGPMMESTAIAFGGQIGIRIDTIGKSNFRLRAAAGPGLGRYVANNAYAGAYLAPNGDLKPINIWGFTASYQQWLTDTIRLNISPSYSAALNNPDVADPAFMSYAGMNKSLLSMHTNIIWNVTKKWYVGIEHVFAQRQREAGPGTAAADAEGTLHRVFGSTRFKF